MRPGKCSPFYLFVRGKKFKRKKKGEEGKTALLLGLYRSIPGFSGAP